MRNIITIDGFDCITEEVLADGKRGLPNNNPHWDMTHYEQGMISSEDTHPTVALALAHICHVLGFDYVRADWRYSIPDKTFRGEFFVDESNNQITEEEYEMWKRGEKRIWACKVTAVLLMTETRRINSMDLPKLGY